MARMNTFVLDVIDYWSLPACSILCKLSAATYDNNEGIWTTDREVFTSILSSNVIRTPHGYVYFDILLFYCRLNIYFKDGVVVSDCHCVTSSVDTVFFLSHPREIVLTEFECANPLTRKSIYLEQGHDIWWYVLAASLLVCLLGVVWRGVFTHVFSSPKFTSKIATLEQSPISYYHLFLCRARLGITHTRPCPSESAQPVSTESQSPEDWQISAPVSVTGLARGEDRGERSGCIGDGVHGHIDDRSSRDILASRCSTMCVSLLSHAASPLPPPPCTPPLVTPRYASTVFVSKLPPGTAIPWDVLLCCSEANDDGSTRLSHFILDVYLSVPLHVHVPELNTCIAPKGPIGSCGQWRQTDHTSRFRRGADGAVAISPIPQWRKKGPMHWDNVRTNAC